MPSLFDNNQKSDVKLPSELGVWLFVIGDMLVFALLFISYAYNRSQQSELFIQSQDKLSQIFGVMNTLLLLTGSLFVVLALHFARLGFNRVTRTLLLAAIATGLMFFVNKVFEYSDKVNQGYTLITNDFFMYYYMLTGIHLLHVCVATGVLFFLWLKLARSNNDDDIKHLESGGIVWHMVDLLWIVLFPLLYLIK